METETLSLSRTTLSYIDCDSAMTAYGNVARKPSGRDEVPSSLHATYSLSPEVRLTGWFERALNSHSLLHLLSEGRVDCPLSQINVPSSRGRLMHAPPRAVHRCILQIIIHEMPGQWTVLPLNPIRLNGQGKDPWPKDISGKKGSRLRRYPKIAKTK